VRADLYLKTKPLPWSHEVKVLKERIESLLDVTFDYVLLNLYRDGKDHIGFHADGEAIAEGKNTIASLSVGATRRFVMRHKYISGLQKEFMLNSGSLFVMQRKTQQFWKHALPKQAKVNSPRINLTFRKA